MLEKRVLGKFKAIDAGRRAAKIKSEEAQEKKGSESYESEKPCLFHSIIVFSHL
jgi:hypothetical protein